MVPCVGWLRLARSTSLTSGFPRRCTWLNMRAVAGAGVPLSSLRGAGASGSAGREPASAGRPAGGAGAAVVVVAGGGGQRRGRQGRGERGPPDGARDEAELHVSHSLRLGSRGGHWLMVPQMPSLPGVPLSSRALGSSITIEFTLK